MASILAWRFWFARCLPRWEEAGRSAPEVLMRVSVANSVSRGCGSPLSDDVVADIVLVVVSGPSLAHGVTGRPARIRAGG